MPILYSSTDNGELYLESQLDDDQKASGHFEAYEVPETVTFQARELCGGYGQIVEILLHADKMTRVVP